MSGSSAEKDPEGGREKSRRTRTASPKKATSSPSGKAAKKASKKRTSKAGGAGNGSAKKKPKTLGPRPASSDAVAALPAADLADLWRYWAGKGDGAMPREEGGQRDQVLGWMRDPDVLELRMNEMSRRLVTILDAHLSAPGYECTVSDLTANKQLAYLSSYDLQASLAVLSRHALLAEVASGAVERFGQRAYAVPTDLGDQVVRMRRSRRRGVFDVVTLKGHLERAYSDPARAKRMSAARLRELYKMYSNETAAVARLDRLPDGLRALIEKVILQFGGVLPRSLFERMTTDVPQWSGRRWARVLEDSLVGTVERLDLEPFGLNHSDETIVVFNEVALAWLKRVAVPGDPDAPHDEAALGVDLVSNISRFIGFIIDHNVRFTVRGEIFKTTEKRILQELIPNPGRELERSEVLQFIYHFAREARLIESTGERTFALTSAGREWEPQPLDAKLHTLLDYTIDESELGGEAFHQVRMRRTYLRLLKRVEPEVWYDLMYLPFLTRNTYLANLDDLGVEEHFAGRSNGGSYTPQEDLQRLAWNLVGWVRKRLYLLGLVDLGYDSAGRPVAMRLTRLGARLLGMSEESADTFALGNLVITPDFEVVLFPTGDDGELVHDLDRFCAREKNGHLLHFRIVEKGVHRALAEGMHLKRILATLESNSRTPVPQNVVYTIRDWAARAGLLFLSPDRSVRCEDPETFKRFRQDPGVRPYLQGVLDDRRVKLKAGSTAKRLQSVLRELDYLVELED